MPAEAPRLTVLTSVYNGAPYLVAAIDSILGQTCGDFEYLLVDDASTDESAQIIAHYAHLDARIRAVLWMSLEAFPQLFDLPQTWKYLHAWRADRIIGRRLSSRAAPEDPTPIDIANGL